MSRNIRKILYYFGLFADADIEWIVRNGEKRLIKNGETLIERGRFIDNVFIILDGKFAVCVDRGKPVAELDAGEILGEMSFIDKIPTSATVRASTDSRVLAIDRERLSAKLEDDKDFAIQFYKAIAMYLSDRLRHNSSHREPLAGPAEEEELFSSEEINEMVLANLDAASARFNRLIQQLAE